MSELEVVSRDERGWIQRVIRPDGREVIFIYTRRGFWRGGEYHKSGQHDFLFFGKLHWLTAFPADGGGYPPEYQWETFDQDQHNRSNHILPYQAHVVRAEEDTLYSEWLDGGFEKAFFPEMRRRVEAQLGSKDKK